jgi:hypothetical protein
VQHIKLDDANPPAPARRICPYAEYQNRSGVRFATKRVISVSEKKKLDIRLDFKQYAFNEPVEFPFAIPKNFSAR